MDTEPRITMQLLAVLNTMLEAPLADWYGLELVGRVKLKSGTIYPLLARLERFGWLTSREEDIDPSTEGRPRKRLYRLTAEGERAARKHVAASLELLGASSTHPPERRGAGRLRPGGQTA